jgi:uncharacterized LabA/DUF88 family protein
MSIRPIVARPIRELMIFIDGGYLRKGLEHFFGEGNDQISYVKLRDYIVTVVDSQGLKSDIIRAYYYDGIVDPLEEPEKYQYQNAYFDDIRKRKFFEVRLARNKLCGTGYRQKGVDILISVDMLTKAYMGHYDIAAFLGGDDDFLDLVSAVKNLAGKRVYGFYFDHNVSSALADCFDVECNLTKQKLKVMVPKLKKVTNNKT